MLRKKPKNRRKKREEHILNVRAHSDYRRTERLERATIALGSVLVLGIAGLGLYWLTKLVASKFFYENPNFALAQVLIETDGHLTQDKILRIAGVRAGQSIFEVDLQQMKRDLELDPLVERAEVGRELPNHLRIAVKQRVPLAQICVQPFPGSGPGPRTPIVFYVDRFGVAMPAYEVKSSKPLPALTGVRLADIRVGKPIRSQQVFAALDLLRQMAMSQVGARFEPHQIDLSRNDTLKVLTRTGETVLFDPLELTQGLRRLGIILADVERNGLALGTVDLTVHQNVPVTFRPAQDRGARNL